MTHQDFLLLELVKVLEKKDQFEPKIIAECTEQAKQGDDDILEKLIKRAELLDASQDHTLSSILDRHQQKLKLLEYLWTGGYFIFGFLGAMGLIAGQVINFFYVFITLLGWHSLTLLWWIFSSKKPNISKNILEFIINSLKPNDQQFLSYHAFCLILTEKQKYWHWYLGKLVHQAWIFGLLGNLLALFLLFLVKAYAFTWQSTLLSTKTLSAIIAIVGFLPNKLGIAIPNLTNPSPNLAFEFAMLILISLVFYGILPRALVWFYCVYHQQTKPKLNTNEFYYQNLIRTFKQQIIAQDDYTPSPPLPAQAKITNSLKLTASLELSLPELWYQFGAGFSVIELGTIDTVSDLERLQHSIQTQKAMVYLGIDTSLLPDRGTVRKLEKISTLAQYGFGVELISTQDQPNYKTQWQQILIERDIGEIRY